jgi:acetyl esterase/lipase
MNKKIILPVTVFLIASLACNASRSATPESVAPTAAAAPQDEFSLPASTVQPAPKLPGGVQNLISHTSKIDPDVTYCTVQSTDLKMDLYFPKSLGGSAPIVVYIHGGGWSKGDKRDTTSVDDFPAFLDAGFIVSAVNYRLAPQYQFPAMIDDVKCAIRFLRANAGPYGIDPNKMGVWGGSAGGHLVSLLGVTDRSAGFDVGQHLDQSSRVQAVADMFGPADLPAFFPNTGLLQLRDAVFGSYDLAKASPVTYITADDPPFLILQGDADTTVPPSQSQEFYAKLTAAGLTANLVMVKGGNHGLSNPNENPPRADLINMIVQFFKLHLK